MSILDNLANSISKKGDNIVSNDTKQCSAAKKIITRGDSLIMIKSGKECYFHKEKYNSVYKEFIYTRCLKPCNVGSTFCNSHKSNNFKTFEFIKTNENSRLASIKDFDNVRDLNPISIIEKNKKSKAYFMLKKYAETLLSENLHNINHIENKKRSSKKKESITNTVQVNNDISEIEQPIMDSSDEESNNEVDNEDIEELDENDLVKVTSNNNTSYYINGDEAYGENDDETYSKVGVFTETKKKYHTIIHNEKYYTIFFNYEHARKGSIHLCVISNKIYDKKMNHIGNGIKKSSETDYDLEFFDEI